MAHEVLQWFICRLEAWFAADADTISLKNWDQVTTLPCYHCHKFAPRKGDDEDSCYRIYLFYDHSLASYSHNSVEINCLKVQVKVSLSHLLS